MLCLLGLTLNVSDLFTPAVGTTCQKSHRAVTNTTKRTATSTFPAAACKVQESLHPKPLFPPSISLYSLPSEKQHLRKGKNKTPSPGSFVQRRGEERGSHGGGGREVREPGTQTAPDLGTHHPTKSPSLHLPPCPPPRCNSKRVSRTGRLGSHAAGQSFAGGADARLPRTRHS